MRPITVAGRALVRKPCKAAMHSARGMVCAIEGMPLAPDPDMPWHPWQEPARKERGALILRDGTVRKWQRQQRCHHKHSVQGRLPELR